MCAAGAWGRPSRTKLLACCRRIGELSNTSFTGERDSLLEKRITVVSKGPCRPCRSWLRACYPAQPLPMLRGNQDDSGFPQADITVGVHGAHPDVFSQRMLYSDIPEDMADVIAWADAPRTPEESGDLRTIMMVSLLSSWQDVSCGVRGRPAITIESSRDRQSTLQPTSHRFHRFVPARSP